MLISAQSEFTNVMVLAPFRVTRLCGMRSDLNGGEKQVPDQTGGTEGWRAERLEGGKAGRRKGWKAERSSTIRHLCLAGTDPGRDLGRFTPFQPSNLSAFQPLRTCPNGQRTLGPASRRILPWLRKRRKSASSIGIASRRCFTTPGISCGVRG